MILVLDGDEVQEYLRYLAGHICICKQETILRPQKSGPCVHIDSADDDDPDVVRALGLACRHPDGTCPHLDNPEILCPVKDACEAEQEEQDADMAAKDAVYETETPEFVEPTPEEEPVYEASPRVGEVRLDARGWTPEEERAMCGATTPAEAVALYRAAYPGSSRTDAAIKTRYHLKIRPRRHGADGPLPDFAGDTVPVTQCEEPASKSLYGDARALHADMMDGMMCDRPIDACDPIVRGDRVALVDDPGLVGTAVIVNNRSKFASVEFPDDDGPARVYPLSALRRVIV